ncbi:PAAR domain-containing protein [Herbaspirillum lusitanum]|uniref:PAAR domain-containing protein n=1 Tax=Herbaspirillum lusitanum TaxID=213312 RepID=A0ABW9ABD8_9BURK
MMDLLRQGDVGTHPGSVIISASGKMSFGGRAVARKGDKVHCPKCKTSPNVLIEGDEGMLDNGLPIARHGHRAACGCRLISSLR